MDPRVTIATEPEFSDDYTYPSEEIIETQRNYEVIIEMFKNKEKYIIDKNGFILPYVIKDKLFKSDEILSNVNVFIPPLNFMVLFFTMG